MVERIKVKRTHKSYELLASPYLWPLYKHCWQDEKQPVTCDRMSWWRHQMDFRVTDPFCGDFTGPGEFPAQRPVTRSFDVFFDLRLNKRLSKQSWGWWFETSPWSLWRHCNVFKAS